MSLTLMRRVVLFRYTELYKSYPEITSVNKSSPQMGLHIFFSLSNFTVRSMGLFVCQDTGFCI